LSFERKIAPDEIQAALNRIGDQQSLLTTTNAEEKLERAYDLILNRIENHPQIAAVEQLLVWIVCARRPLTVSELQHTLLIEHDNGRLDMGNVADIDDMVSSCYGLVTIEDESGIVRLVHSTAQDYLEQLLASSRLEKESHITKICVTYLSHNVFGSGRCLTDGEYEKRVAEHKFFQYAARYWGHHARGLKVPQLKTVVEFLGRQPQVEAASQALLLCNERYSARYPRYSQKVPSNLSGRHLLAYFGLEEAVQWALSREGSSVWSARNRHGLTPMAWAAACGQDSVVKLLADTIEGSADLEDKEGRTPLSWAAENGHTTTVASLLAKGVCPDSRGSHGRSLGRSPLSYAAHEGHDGVVELLLQFSEDKKVDVNSLDGSGWTPLNWAAGYNLNSAGVDSRTPLMWAAEWGCDWVVSRLLATGQADVNARDACWRTALHWAAEFGHDEIVRQLLDTDQVDIDSQDLKGDTPQDLAELVGESTAVLFKAARSMRTTAFRA